MEQVAGNSGRTIDTLIARTILPASLEHETPASSWGLDQLALRNCSWFPLRLASRIEADDHATPVAASQRPASCSVKKTRGNLTREEMTRCRGSPIQREYVKSESWVSLFGEFVPPQNSGDSLAFGHRVDRSSCQSTQCRSHDRFREVMWPPTAVPQTVNEGFCAFSASGMLRRIRSSTRKARRACSAGR